jgi:hypothetical protein
MKQIFWLEATRSHCLMVPLHNSHFAMNLLRNFAGSFTQSSQLKLHDADENYFPARDFLGMENFNELRCLFSSLSGQWGAIRGKLSECYQPQAQLFAIEPSFIDPHSTAHQR